MLMPVLYRYSSSTEHQPRPLLVPVVAVYLCLYVQGSRAPNPAGICGLLFVPIQEGDITCIGHYSNQILYWIRSVC